MSALDLDMENYFFVDADERANKASLDASTDTLAMSLDHEIPLSIKGLNTWFTFGSYTQTDASHPPEHESVNSIPDVNVNDKESFGMETSSSNSSATLARENVQETWKECGNLHPNETGLTPPSNVFDISENAYSSNSSSKTFLDQEVMTFDQVDLAVSMNLPCSSGNSRLSLKGSSPIDSVNIFSKLYRQSHRIFGIADQDGQIFGGFRPLVVEMPEVDIECEMQRNLICPSEGDENSAIIFNSDDSDGWVPHSGKSDVSSTKNIMTGQSIIRKCIGLISSAVSPTGGAEYFTILDENVSRCDEYSASKNGIAKQRIINYMSAIYMPDDDIRAITESWVSTKQRSDTFFRAKNKRGGSFSLVELVEALRSITSRPPRRINHYPAYQLGTHGNMGQGQTVSDWGNKQLSTMHCPSNSTRTQRATLPPRAALESADDEGKTQSDIEPTLNRKKQENNIYDPTWVRGSGKTKEGWCDHCEIGGYFLMKNSGYLYHKNHEHGIYPSGNVFEDPLVIRRKLERESKWEGLCGICYHWIDLDHTDRKHWGTWYRHYKQCANEYEEFKKILAASGAPIRLIEIFYKPYRDESPSCCLEIGDIQPRTV